MWETEEPKPKGLPRRMEIEAVEESKRNNGRWGRMSTRNEKWRLCREDCKPPIVIAGTKNGLYTAVNFH